jgi:hypothetical protein
MNSVINKDKISSNDWFKYIYYVVFRSAEKLLPTVFGLAMWRKFSTKVQ